MIKEPTMENQSLTSNWEYGTLEDAVNKGSSNISLNKVKEDDGEYQLYSAKGYNKNISFFHQEKEYLAIIKDGAGIGRVSKHPAKSSVVATMQYLIPKEGFDIGFVQYFLNGIDFESHRQGSTIPHVYFKDYKSELFPLLPLPQQKQIVTILDKAFAAIDTAKTNAEQNLQNAKELFESYLQNVFENKGDDWEEKTLGDVLQKTETVNPKSTPNNEFVYLDVSSVNKETKLIEKTTTLLGKDAPSRARKLVKTNDIIFATVRPTHSRVAIITDEYNNQVCSTGYYVLRPKSIIENHYLFYFILTFSFNKLMESMQKGASYPAVNNKEVESVVINFPKSIKEQQKIVERLDSLSTETKKLEAIYTQKIADLEEMKKSVLQKAFSGQLNTIN
jgi:type I restriction enzyme S subunit